MITLRDAIKEGRLSDFIAQEESRGIGPAERKKLDTIIAAAIRAPRSKRQTLRSPSRGGSRGK